MYNTKPVTSIFLDTRREKKDKTYPVKLRITFHRKRKYYSITKKSLTESDFEKVMGDKPRGNFRKTRLELDEFKHDADEVIRKMDAFTFEQFELNFFKKTSQPDDVFSFFDSYIEELESEDRLNTAESYSYAKKSIQDFCSCAKLSFDRISVEFLEKYEKQMLQDDKSISTIGIYLRSLRTIINLAIKKGIAKNYPFGKGRNLFTIKNPLARKMALTTEELKKLFGYDSFKTTVENYYFDLWKFSYLCSGMNAKDICSLKYSNIERDRIYYKREKTKRTNYNGKEIIIPMASEIKTIVDKWGQNPRDPDIFVFPILNKNMTPKQIQATIKQNTSQINKYTDRVAKRIEIDIKVSSYTARHSYATQLMRHGAPTVFISKQLGHASIETTNSYLENFEERQLNEWQSKVTDFDL